MRRVANGHPSALVIERCQPGSRFTWGGVPVRGKIPANCIQTQAYARTIPPEISFWPDIQVSSALFKLCLFLSLPLYIFPVSSLSLGFSWCSQLCSVYILTLFFVFLLQILSLSFNRTALRGSGGVSGAVCLCAVSVLWKPLVWWNFWCVPTVMCHHQLLPHSAHLWTVCSLRQHKQKQLKLTLALPIITISNEICLTVFSEKSHLNAMYTYSFYCYSYCFWQGGRASHMETSQESLSNPVCTGLRMKKIGSIYNNFTNPILKSFILF